jgi:hypothetical protein
MNEAQKGIQALLICIICTVEALAQGGKITLVNPTNHQRTDQPFVVKRVDWEQNFNPIPDGHVPTIKAGKQGFLPLQLDDLNGDGKWDEIAFLANLKPNEVLMAKVKYVKEKKAPKYVQRANVRLGVSFQKNGIYETVKSEMRPADWTPQAQPPRYQMEGPGWENDKVAFRNYFDSRNGMDIFGKLVSRMRLDSIGWNEDYHKLQPWGMDILKVGTSLGAGAVAVEEYGKLLPLEKTATAKYESIATGPVRGILKLTYQDWEAGASKYNLSLTISIWAGKYWYQNDVVLSGFTGIRQMASGVVNLKNNQGATNKTIGTDMTTIITHAKQSENDDLLGMALLVPFNNFKGFTEAPKAGEPITATYISKFEVKPDLPSSYYFLSGWEKSDSRFASQATFEKFVIEEAEKIAKPAQLSFIKK